MKKIIFDLIQICLKYKCNELYISNTVDKDKLRNVRIEYKIPKDESIAAIFDNTVFGNAKNGWAVCGNGIYYNNPWFTGKDTGHISWEELCDAETTKIDYYTIGIGMKHKLYCINHCRLAMQLLEELKCYINKNCVRRYDKCEQADTSNEQSNEKYGFINKPMKKEYVDINLDPIDEIILLPYFTYERAEILIKEREKRFGFRFVDEIEGLLKLKPHEIEKIREYIIISPYTPKQDRRIIDL